MFLKEFFEEKVDFEKSKQMTKKAWKITQNAKGLKGRYHKNAIIIIVTVCTLNIQTYFLCVKHILD